MIGADLVRELAAYAQHRPSCNSRAGRFACGAVNGRRGKCGDRATLRYEGQRLYAHRLIPFTLYRCSSHPYRGTPSQLPEPLACSCGLADLLARVSAPLLESAPS